MHYVNEMCKYIRGSEQEEEEAHSKCEEDIWRIPESLLSTRLQQSLELALGSLRASVALRASALGLFRS